MEVRAGTSGYSYKEWKGDFYPAKLAPAEMLAYYASACRGRDQQHLLSDAAARGGGELGELGARERSASRSR
jgi:hypothetical protein